MPGCSTLESAARSASNRVDDLLLVHRKRLAHSGERDEGAPREECDSGALRRPFLNRPAPSPISPG